jgi:hypothetical protein
MGQFIQKIAVTLLLAGTSCKSTIQTYEYAFFTYERGLPISYKTVLVQEKEETIRQIYYAGSINLKRGKFNPGFYPDTACGGFSHQGQFGYRRWGNFHRCEYDKDTIMQCFCFDRPVPFYGDGSDKDLHDNLDYYELCRRLKNSGVDTIFNKIISVVKYREYQFYNCCDTNYYNNGVVDIFVDIERRIVIQYSFWAHKYAVDEYAKFTKIENVNKVSDRYFNILWEQAQDESFLDCSPL